MEIQHPNSNRTISIKSIKLAYKEVGKGKIPIVLLHGFPFNNSMWDNQLEVFKKTHRLISLDFRSFGHSSTDSAALSIDLLTDDLIEFLNALDLKKVIICGLSIGGFVALNALKKFPERFCALVLCNTQCAADTPIQKKKREATIQEIETNGIANFSNAFLHAVFHETTYSINKKLVAKLKTLILGNTSKVIIEGLKALAEREETCSSLGAIAIPTLIISGRTDQITPLEQSEFMHKNIKKATLKVIENAGHLSNLEQPEVFNQTLSLFLNSKPVLEAIASSQEPNSNMFA